MKPAPGRRFGRGRLVTAIALGALTLASAPAAGAEIEPRASLPDIEDEVMCPICGTTLEVSQAPQAERERALIRNLIAEGHSKEEIKQALVDEYGEEVLAVPDTDSFDLVAWVLPATAIPLAALALLWGLRRRRAEPPAPPRDLSTADAGRLEAELANWDEP